MFYPNHQIRDYCVYLGSLESNGRKMDMGVYEHPDGKTTSHAIVYGNEDSNYFSGEFEFYNPNNFKSWYYKINEELYKEYLNKKENLR